MNPLIWTFIYGKDTYFNVLELSLESLVRYGKYQGNLCLFSDRSVEHTLQYVPIELREKTTVLPFPPTSKLDLTIRYECAQYLPDNHDMYLFADADIIYDDDISPILFEICKTDKIYFTSEKNMYPALQKPIGELRGKEIYNSDWFGLSIALDDGKLDNCILPLVNAGFFGCSNFDNFKLFCRSVKETIPTINPEYITEYSEQPVVNYVIMHDQPVFNYVSMKFGYDTSLTRYIHFTNSSPNENNVRLGVGLRGMMHFVWAGERKEAEMSAYLAILGQIKVEAPWS